MDNTVRLWSADAASLGRPVVSFSPLLPSYLIRRSKLGLVFSPDGRLIASVSHDRTVWLWSAEAASLGRPVGQPLAGHRGPVGGVAFSPDGRLVASASGDGTVRLWSAEAAGARR
jgi:WD40 repeat protein